MTKEFLNEEMKPYNELTREEKHILLDAVLDQQLQCFYGKSWSTVYLSEGFNNYSVYRTKPKEYKKLDIPWEVIATIYNYAAMDENGDIYFYDVLPDWLPIHKECSFSGSEVVQASCLKLETTDIIAEHSLTKRPEGEAK